jgi:hypothetical protein
LEEILSPQAKGIASAILIIPLLQKNPSLANVLGFEGLRNVSLSVEVDARRGLHLLAFLPFSHMRHVLQTQQNLMSALRQTVPATPRRSWSLCFRP